MTTSEKKTKIKKIRPTKRVSQNSVSRRKKNPSRQTKKTPKTRRLNKSSNKQQTTKKKVGPKLQAEKVVLPTATGPRLKAKTVATRDFIELLHTPMYRIAYVTAFSFLLVGVAGLLFTDSLITNSHLASVCISNDCNTTEDGSENLLPNEINREYETQNPSVEFENVEPASLVSISSVPNEITNEVQISFRVEGTEEVEVTLLSLETGASRELSIVRLSSKNYRFTINPEDLETGRYQIRVVLFSAGETHEFVGNSFTVPVLENRTTEFTTSSLNELSTTSTTNVAPQIQTTEHQMPIDSSAIEQYSLESSGPELSKGEFGFSQVNTQWTDREIIKIEAPDTHQKVQLYLRPQNSLQSQYLGTTFRENQTLMYVFDSQNYPNGTYELFAVADTRNGLITSDSVIVTINNRFSGTTSNETITEEQLLKTSSPIRHFYEAETRAENEVVKEFTTNSQTVAEQILNDNLDVINDLMKRYAVARQSENELLLEAAEEELQLKQKELVKEFISNVEAEITIAQIEAILRLQIADIKLRVDAFEDIRRSRLAGTVSRDSDNDGISDFDEINVYGTNPYSADSDGDGFSDGAEIIRGYNPNDPTTEAIVDYELPTEVVGLIRDDVLKIKEIRPLIIKADTDTQTYAEVVGTGLPNSFMTLYIFSTPVIVTVKTGDDGSFVYRFDKELADGEHEVYVAFTDNAGAILAHSEPFRFVKQAQAFSPIDVANDSSAVTAPTVVEATSVDALQLTLSLSLILLGFFLLMLGINIRESNSEITKTQSAA